MELIEYMKLIALVDLGSESIVDNRHMIECFGLEQQLEPVRVVDKAVGLE